MKQIIGNSIIEVVKESTNNMISSKINAIGREDKDDAFFVADLGDIVHKYKEWYRQLPRVVPHYAVKCNDDPVVLSLLAQLGTGFDCASKAEIQKILDLKVDTSRIVYANPCKQTSHIRFAAKNNVPLMTFDNVDELHKVKAVYPDAKLVLRILPPDDTKSQCQLGMKFGAHPKNAPHLLETAFQLGLSVVGVSFHVGSGCWDATAFSAAVASARTVFDMGEQAGYHFDLLDIGGGFPGQESAKISFQEICSVLRPSLDLYFPESSGVRIIAEPGRYFVASAFTLATNIIAKRVVHRDLAQKEKGCALTGNDEPAFMYYVNDGVYGSFNCLLYDHAEVQASLLRERSDEPHFTSSVWGPTCDGLDCIHQDIQLPELHTGDWIIFKDMGAYTMCAGSTFNGMPRPRSYYMLREKEWVQLKHHVAKREGTKQRDAPINNNKGACAVHHTCHQMAALKLEPDVDSAILEIVPDY